MRKIAPLEERVQTAPVLSTISVPGGTRVLFGDSAPGVGVGVGLGAVPDVVNVHVGPPALTLAMVFPTMRQYYVVPGAKGGSLYDST